MAESIIWAGNGSLPHAAYVSLYMQQMAPRLRVHHMTDANRILKEMKYITLTINFNKQEGGVDTALIWTFLDASYNIVTGREYGQTGIITGLVARNNKGGSVRPNQLGKHESMVCQLFFIRCRDICVLRCRR